MGQPDWDPIIAFAQGDRLRAEGLRRNLEAIHEGSDDPHVRRIVGEVLAGRRTVRELVRDPGFERELDRGMAAFADAWQELGPEERAELVRQGQREEAERRAQLGLPPSDEAPAEVGDSPLLRVEP
jgi:hypothetical protein